MARTKTSWRWQMAERLAKRMSDEPTIEEIEEANHVVWRLCRLANDNERNCERDNDERWMLNPRTLVREGKGNQRAVRQVPLLD